MVSENGSLVISSGALNALTVGDTVTVSLVTTWAEDMEAESENVTVLIVEDDGDSPMVTIDGGLVHYVQWEEGQYVTLSMSYTFCGDAAAAALPSLIEWESVSQSEAAAAGHGVQYNSNSTAAVVEGEGSVLAVNVSTLVLSMDALSPRHVYFYKVTVGSTAEYIQLEVMPPVVVRKGWSGEIGVSIRSDFNLSIRDVFVFGSYLEDDALSAYYSWSWSCTQSSDGRECEAEFVPMDNVAVLPIEHRMMRGKERYQYTVTVYDHSYGVFVNGSYTVSTHSLEHAQIGSGYVAESPSGWAMAESVSVNPLYQGFQATMTNIPSSAVSRSWTLPDGNWECDESAAFEDTFSLYPVDPATCDLAFGSIQRISYEVTFDEVEVDWPNTATVAFDVFVNIPPFGGVCTSNNGGMAVCAH